MELHDILSVTATNEADVYLVSADITDANNERFVRDYITRPEDPFGVNPEIRQWLVDHAGDYTVLSYVEPPPAPYRISKTTPWLRMTDAEADLVYAQMAETSSRLRAIYDAASYLSSDDPLWTTLHDLLAATLSSDRADALLAPET